MNREDKHNDNNYYENEQNYRQYKNSKKKQVIDNNPYTYNDKNINEYDYYEEYNNTRDTYNDYNNYEYDEYDEYENIKNSSGLQTLMFIQLGACVLIVLCIFALKQIGGSVYEGFTNWYKTQLNKSIIVGESSENYKMAYNSLIQSIKDKINSESSNSDNNEGSNFDNNESSNTENDKSSSSSAVAETFSLDKEEIEVDFLLDNPIKNGVITSNFDDEREHKGVDIAADKGTPIVCAREGIVEATGESDTYGKYIKINHGDGVFTFYAHCDNIEASKLQNVSKGETIAEVGSTGDSTGDHLHLELIINGKYYNPLPLINGVYS